MAASDTAPSASTTPPTTTPDPAQPSGPRRWRLMAGVVVGLAVLLAGGLWLYKQFTHVNVLDSRVAADMVVLSSRVPGWVTEVKVIEGDSAGRGQLLVSIGERENRLQLQELDARLDALIASRHELSARIAMVDHQTRSQVDARQAAVSVTQATLASANARRHLASVANRRVEKLVGQGAVNQARVDQTRTDLETARQDASGAQAQLHSAQAALAEAKADREQLKVLKRQLAGLDAQHRQWQAQRQQAALDLADRTLVMPFAGVVDRVFVDKGEYVTPGQRLLMVHDPQGVRVEANVKETDIRFFRPGKPVTVSVDALPDQTFEGRVERIGQAATSEFALLPSPNPSGNFTKITQRLPIRIAVQQHDGLLKPGMMVELETRAGD